MKRTIHGAQTAPTHALSGTPSRASTLVLPPKPTSQTAPARTPTRAPVDPGFFWEAVERSNLFDLFPVRWTGKSKLRYVIHRPSGISGALWFKANSGQWGTRQGLIVRLTLARWGSEDIPRKALDAQQGYAQTSDPLMMQEKSFLPEEVSWALERLDASLRGEDEAAYRWSTDAWLLGSWLEGDGRYRSLMPSSPTTPTKTFPGYSLEEFFERCDEQEAFAARLFSLWHGPTSQREDKAFCAFGRETAPSWPELHRYSPHLKKLVSEAYRLKSRVEAGQTSYDEAMFGVDSFKSRLQQIVGDGAVHPALRTSEIWDFVLNFFLEKTGYR